MSVSRDKQFCENGIQMCTPSLSHGRVFVKGREVASSGPTNSMLQKNGGSTAASFVRHFLAGLKKCVNTVGWSVESYHDRDSMEQRSEGGPEGRAPLRPREKRDRRVRPQSSSVTLWQSRGFMGTGLRLILGDHKATWAAGLESPRGSAQNIVPWD